jgi:hypothetical protein
MSIYTLNEGLIVLSAGGSGVTSITDGADTLDITPDGGIYTIIHDETNDRDAQVTAAFELMTHDTDAVTELDAIKDRLPVAIGTQLAAASLSVVLAYDGTFPLATGAATSAKQDTGNNSLSNIEGYVDGLETLIGTTNTSLSTISGYLDGLEGSVDGLETSLSNIEGYVDGLETLIGTTNTTLSNISGYVDGLEGFVDGLEGFTDGIEGSLSNIEGYVDGLEGLIGTTNTALSNISGYVDGIETLLGGTAQVKVWDGSNIATVKAASVAPVAADPALVVSISPNSPAISVVSASAKKTGALAIFFNDFSLANLTSSYVGANFTIVSAANGARVVSIHVVNNSGAEIIFGYDTDEIDGGEVDFALVAPGFADVIYTPVANQSVSRRYVIKSRSGTIASGNVYININQLEA